MLFVTHSIEEAITIGNRILLLSPHPGQVKAELNSGRASRCSDAGANWKRASTHMLFADQIDGGRAWLSAAMAVTAHAAGMRPRDRVDRRAFGVGREAAVARSSGSYDTRLAAQASLIARWCWR